MLIFVGFNNFFVECLFGDKIMDVNLILFFSLFEFDFFFKLLLVNNWEKMDGFEDVKILVLIKDEDFKFVELIVNDWCKKNKKFFMIKFIMKRVLRRSNDLELFENLRIF